MLNLKPGYIEIDFKVEGTKLHGQKNIYNEISIIENASVVVPMIRIVFDNSDSTFEEEFAIVDGTKLTAKIVREGEGGGREMDFRVCAIDFLSKEDGPKVTVIGMLDVPKYLARTKNRHYEGTSQACLQKVAGESGLQFYGNGSTNDRMIWLNVITTKGGFARRVARHGYVNDQSCMVVCTTAIKEMLYFDINKQMTQEPKGTFYLNVQPEKAGWMALGVRNVSTSGVANYWMNYGYEIFHHSLTGEQQKEDTCQARPLGGVHLPINSNVKSETEMTRRDYLERLDCGNTHDKYNRAMYQNMRYAALYSEKLEIVVEETTGLRLLDPVAYEKIHPHLYPSGPYQQAKDTGGYIVEAKVTSMKFGSRYFEKFLISRPSVRLSGKSSLL